MKTHHSCISVDGNPRRRHSLYIVLWPADGVSEIRKRRRSRGQVNESSRPEKDHIVAKITNVHSGTLQPKGRGLPGGRCMKGQPRHTALKYGFRTRYGDRLG